MNEKILPIRKKNLNDLIELESICFPTPWIEKDFKVILTREKTAAFYYELDDKMIGYIIYEMKPKHVLLINFAVHPDHRNKKIGTELLDFLTSKLNHKTRFEIICYVDEYNLNAQLFLKKRSFFATHNIKNFFENDSGAIYFMYSLPPKKESKK
jgi:ribosomal-protein-alanine N-acetyltransferase